MAGDLAEYAFPVAASGLAAAIVLALIAIVRAIASASPDVPPKPALAISLEAESEGRPAPRTRRISTAGLQRARRRRPAEFDVYVARAHDGGMLASAQHALLGDEDAALDAAFDREEVMRMLESIAAQPPRLARCSVDVDVGSCTTIHYVVEQGLCYLLITSGEYPEALAYAFLEALRCRCIEKMTQLWGRCEWRTELAAAKQPPQRLADSLCAAIYELKAGYDADPRSPRSLAQLLMLQNPLATPMAMAVTPGAAGSTRGGGAAAFFPAATPRAMEASFNFVGSEATASKYRGRPGASIAEIVSLG